MSYKTLISKGDIMRRIYSEDELRKIDSATPMHSWKEFPPIDHVMNYNEPNTYGKLDNLNEVAKERGIVLYHEPKIAWADFNNLTYAIATLKLLVTNHGDPEDMQAFEAIKEYIEFDKIKEDENSNV